MSVPWDALKQISQVQICVRGQVRQCTLLQRALAMLRYRRLQIAATIAARLLPAVPREEPLIRNVFQACCFRIRSLRVS